MRGRYILTCSLLLFLLCPVITPAGLGANSSLIRDATSRRLGEFYSLLRSLSGKSDDSQIHEITIFIKKYPDCRRAYEKLFERLLIYFTPREATAHFEKLKVATKNKQYCDWMLAKIYHQQQKYTAATEAFRMAIQQGETSIEFVRDLVKFEQSRKDLDNDDSFKNLLNSELQTIYSLWFHYFNEKYDKAMTELNQLPEGFLKEPIILYVMGDCYLNLGQSEQALSTWKKGAHIASEISDVFYQSLFEIGYGYAATWKRAYEAAYQYYDKADSLARSIEDYYLTQLILGLRGFIQNLSGEYEASIVSYSQAEKIANKIGADYWLSTWLLSHAQILFALGEYSESLDVFQGCGKVTNKLNLDHKKIDLNIRRSTLYNYLGHNNYAKKVLLEAKQLAGSIGRRDKEYFANALMAVIQLEEGEEYEEARKAFNDYLNFLQASSALRTRAYWIAQIAETYLKEKRYDEAKQKYQEAFQAAEVAGSTVYMLWYQDRLADTEVLSGNYVAGIENYEDILRNPIIKEHEDLLSEVYLGMGQTFKKLGDFKNAIASYRKASSIAEKTINKLTTEKLRVSYFSRNVEAYQNLVDCYFLTFMNEQNDAYVDSIFYYLQKERGRTLSNIETKKDSVTTNEAFLQAAQHLRSIQRQLRINHRNLHSNEAWDDVMAQLSAARLKLVSERLNFYSIALKTKPTRSLTEVLTTVQHRNLAVLFYHISKDAAFVFITLADTAMIANLQTESNIVSSLVDSLVQPLHNVKANLLTSAPFRARVAHQLYKLIFEPVTKKAELPERVMIIPDTPLLSLPFEMLLSQEPDKSTYTVLDDPAYASYFLQHDYSFSYAPSITLLQEAAKPISNSLTVFVFSNPELKLPAGSKVSAQLTLGTGFNFSPLLFAKEEAYAIKEVFSGTKIFDRKKATKQQLRDIKSHNDIIHFATHAFADTTFDEFAGIVLSLEDEAADDGILMGYEISDVSLPAELVTMSACETGRGQIVPGEGVLGLPRLFWKAGAKSVLMTHWKVDDEFASRLMPSFYSYLFKEGLSKADALSFAKREILKEKKKSNQIFYYQHPFFWASFTLFGDLGVKKEKNLLKENMFILISLLCFVMILIIFYHKIRNRQNERVGY